MLIAEDEFAARDPATGVEYSARLARGCAGCAGCALLAGASQFQSLCSKVPCMLSRRVPDSDLELKIVEMSWLKRYD